MIPINAKNSFCLALLSLLLLSSSVYSQKTFTVTNTADSGQGSFRQALQDAMSDATYNPAIGHTIKFNITGPGPFIIKPTSNFPSIWKRITIDGFSQPGAAPGAPLIQFDGTSKIVSNCFDMNSAGGSYSVFKGLVIYGFTQQTTSAAIVANTATNLTVQGCFIGTDVTGKIAKPNSIGIWFTGTGYHTVGGPNPEDGNLISGNTLQGVRASGGGNPASNIIVQNNKIGISIDGNPLPNYTGVEFQLNSHNNQIKNNVVSYNKGDGISFNQNSTNNKVYGNTVTYNGEHGVDFLNTDVQSSVVGVDVNGVGEPNIIGYNQAAGVFIGEWLNESTNVFQGGAPSKITVRKNKIYCNAEKGISHTNGSSVKGNNGIPSPQINSLSTQDEMWGTARPGDIIDLYYSDGCNACNSGNSQGETFLATVRADASGKWSFTNNTGIFTCYSLIATATDPSNGNTSEFAATCVPPKFDIRDTTVCKPINLNLDAGTCGVSYRWSTGATTQKVTINNASGSYWVEVTGIDGKVLRDDFRVIISGGPQVNLGPDIIKCAAPFAPAITLDAGNPGMTYLWSTGQTSQKILITQPGTYAVRVTDATGCWATDTLVAKTGGSFTVDLGKDTSICEGQSVKLSLGSTVYPNYLWSDGSSASSITVNTTNKYWVRVADAQGCVSSDTILVTVNPLPVVELGPDHEFCIGNSVVLDAGNPGMTYLWSTGETTQKITRSSSGKITVRITDQNKCSNTDFVNIIVNPFPVLDLGNDISVCNGPVPLSAPAGYSSYLWSSGEQTASISAPDSGKYVLSVKDNNGCTTKDSVKIVFFPKPLVNAGPDKQICEGEKVTLDAGPGFKSYNWIPGNITSRTIEAANAGSYMVNVTDNNGCTTADTILVKKNPNPIVNLGPDKTLCIWPVILDAGPDLIYLWNDGKTSQTYSAGSPGIYKVTVKDANGCSNSDEVELKQGINPVVNLGPERTLCPGDNLILDAGSGYAYSWSTGDTIQKITVTNPGNYSVIITDQLGCKGSSSVKVNANAPAVVVKPPKSLEQCEGTATFSIEAINTNHYQWQYSDDGLSFKDIPEQLPFVNTTTQNLSLNIATSTMSGKVFRCYVKGCSNSDTSATATLLIKPNTDIILQPKSVSVCSGSKASFSSEANNAVSYEWFYRSRSSDPFSKITEGNGFTGTDTKELVIAGASVDMDGFEFQCKALGECNNVTSEIARLNVIKVLVEASGVSPVCPNETTTLSAKSNYPDAFFTWDNESSGATRGVLIDKPGTFWVFATKDGCISEKAYVSIELISIPLIKAGPDTLVCPGTSVMLGRPSLPGITYSWFALNREYSSGIPQPVVNPEISTTYILKAKHPKCQTEMVDTQKVLLIEPIQLYIPNAFTPNGDELNDEFRVVTNNVVDFKATILNRWGEIIFEWDSPEKGWDGTVNQAQVSQNDVYVYVVKARGVCEDKKQNHPLVGTVSLIK